MNKLTKNYLFFTFLIMIICWGTCVICSINDITMKKHFWLFVPYLIGGFSPTIASFIALRRTQNITFKEWIKNIFDFKHSWTSYLLLVILAAAYILPLIFICGYDNGAPIYAIFVMIPLMIIGGGLEEGGWRYILQPELDKQCPHILSTLIVSVIWWLWHLPLFFIQGLPQYNQNYFAFGLNILGMSFALASIRRNTNSVWLCVLFHSLINSLSGIFIIKENIIGNIVTAVILIVLSLCIDEWNKKKEKLTKSL
ncbi:MAG: CPBP family intramembrane metalloprotease [Spirochaetales bacterium]|nr:CPBP family intramembrane metalloprotease [Spirochaetales bacterium]